MDTHVGKYKPQLHRNALWKEQVSFVSEKMSINLEDAIFHGCLKPPSDICRVASDISSALSFLHSHRVVHRDLKLSNILLRLDEQQELVGAVKLAGLGTSRMAYDLNTSSTNSAAAGTPWFMPPEVLRDP